MSTHGRLLPSPGARISAGLGVGALVAWVAGLLATPAQAFQSYWCAWVFWGGVSFGAMAVLMLYYLAPGAWGDVVRLPAEAAIWTLPLVAFAFVPILFGMGHVFPWAQSREALGPHAPHKAAWLTVPWFSVRALLCFGVLAAISLPLAGSRSPGKLTPANLSSLGLIAYFVCMLMASTDWIMSIVPRWYSTILSVVVMASQFLAALSLTTIVGLNRTPTRPHTEKQLRDIGNLLLAFVIFWLYVSFSQLLIIWAGNLPREIAWYLPRSAGGWQYVAGVLVIVQFTIPFALLLSRAAKRNERRLTPIAAVVFIGAAIHSYWLIAPSLHPTGFVVHWLDPVAFIAIGGLWFAAFARALAWRRAPSTVTRDE